MTKKLSKTDFLIGALFTLLALLFGAIGLRLNLGGSVYNLILIVAIVCGGVSLLCFIVGALIGVSVKKFKGLPSEKRRGFLAVFNSAEEKGELAVNGVFSQNFLFYFYYAFLSLLGLAFFCGVSFCIFVYPLALILVPFTFIAVCPLWRLIEYLLKREKPLGLDDGISKSEHEPIYSLFNNLVEKYYGKNYLLKLTFAAPFIMTVEKSGFNVCVYLNEYIFFLLTEREIESVFLRCYLQNADACSKKIKKAYYSREIFTAKVPFGWFFNQYFQLAIFTTALDFEFAQKSLLRTLEKKTDELLVGTGFEEDYLRAYKKFSVFDYSFAVAKHVLNYELCKNVNNLRNYVTSVYEIFLNLAKTRAVAWEKRIESKLKAVICEKLTYAEKSKILGVSVSCGEFYDHTTEAQKTLYDEYNLTFFEGTKIFYEPKLQQIEDLGREVFRYEQEPEKYQERLELINIAHAYYSLAKIDEAESVYKKILSSGDDSSEIHFDYGGFLLLAKDDPNGIAHVYKAMENENFIEDGLDLLGKFLIYYGDQGEYDKYCEYKEKRLDEFAKEYNDKRLNSVIEFTPCKIERSVLDEIVAKITRDENVDELYCADAKTQSGDDITVFAFSVRNKSSEDAFVQTYERIFSILDNEYAKYDTYLVSIEIEMDKKLVEKIKNKDEFLFFRR